MDKLLDTYDYLCKEEYKLYLELRDSRNPEIAAFSEKFMGQRGLDLIKLVNKRRKAVDESIKSTNKK